MPVFDIPPSGYVYDVSQSSEFETNAVIAATFAPEYVPLRFAFISFSKRENEKKKIKSPHYQEEKSTTQRVCKKEKQESKWGKKKRLALLFCAKELVPCLRHAWYWAVHWINSDEKHLNPTEIRQAHRLNETAKVVLLLHALGAPPSSFIPLAKKLSESGIHDIYTVSYHQSRVNPVPIAPLHKKIKQVTQKYLASGYHNVDYLIVGHSLGALVGSKYIWRGGTGVDHAKVSALISIAARLKYVDNPFSWFASDVKPEIDKTYAAYRQNPGKAELFTIWSDQDTIVPKESAHIQNSASQELTVEGWGHLGVIFAPQALSQIVDWVKEWKERHPETVLEHLDSHSKLGFCTIGE